MAQLPRVTQQLFATSGVNQTAVFGTMKTGSPTYSTDIATLMGGVAWSEGWNSAVTAGYAPFMEEFNAIEKINTQQIAYILQTGIPAWDSSTDYYIGDFVKVVSGGDAKIYKAIASSTNKAPASNTAYWSELFASELNGKVDLDGNNATFPHITSTYVNGKDWYRVWSDGWIEQGGETSASTGKATVTFLKPFANTNYTIISSCNTNGDTGGVAEATAINTEDKTTTGVTISQYSSSIRTSSWVAFGY
ncbi:MAG: hypothetical protein J6S67_11285 [Methanobrevibacter sp.]|nr:hypothetical protein [Methanobrevibacter sp.]